MMMFWVILSSMLKENSIPSEIFGTICSAKDCHVHEKSPPCGMISPAQTVKKKMTYLPSDHLHVLGHELLYFHKDWWKL